MHEVQQRPAVCIGCPGILQLLTSEGELIVFEAFAQAFRVSLTSLDLGS